MSRAMRAAFAAELSKLGTLPAVLGAALTTVVAGGLLGALVVASGGAASPAGAVAWAVPVVQAGVMALGVLAFASEYAGRQIQVTLVAMPRRMPLLVAKAGACVLAATLVGMAAVGAGAASAAISLAARGEPAGGLELARLAGAAAYLTAMGLLAFFATVVMRGLVASLAVMLTATLVIGPLLDSVTEHARWLPGQAGQVLFQPDAGAHLSLVAAAGVVVAWVAATGALSAITFRSRDA